MCGKLMLMKINMIANDMAYIQRWMLDTNRPYSPADRGTKKHVYLPYLEAIPFWFYLVPLRLVSIFLNVVRSEISCGILPTRFLPILLKTALLSKK